MKKLNIPILIEALSYEDLSEEDTQLIEEAKKATLRSYAPYSHFFVGAAVRLVNGVIVTGSNQENAAYPSGLCAERTTLFYANSRYPDLAVESLAIAARNETDFVNTPIPPCGACRQVMLETEQRFHHPIRIILYGKNIVYVMNGIGNLLPLSFGTEFLLGDEDK